jgi:hypothetical protein
MSLDHSPNATSSQASQDGHMPLDLQDGQTTEKSGRVAARVSRSASRAKEPELMMNGIYGPTFLDLSAKSARPSLWVSKLQERLGMAGSTECALIWKVKVTPAKALIFRLAQSTRRTSDKGFTGWQTPTVEDASRQGNGDHWIQYTQGDYTTGCRLRNEIHTVKTTWPTPQHNDDNASRAKDPQAYSKRWLEREKSGSNLAHYTQGYYGTTGTTYASTWSTPTLCGNYNRKGASETSADGLATQAAATWPTPTCPAPHDSANSAGNPNIKRKQKGPENYVLEDPASGITQSGSTKQMEKRGALNPEFVCWLMGFPPEWESCAPTAMPSSRKSRQK